MRVSNALDIIINGGIPTKSELIELIDEFQHGGDGASLLYERVRSRAEAVRDEHYGRNVFLRGLIEFTSYCKNDCYYCGLRRSNKNAERYRLTKEQILECCDYGATLGFRTFVLQGGEDAYFTDERVCDIVSSIKSRLCGNVIARRTLIRILQGTSRGWGRQIFASARKCNRCALRASSPRKLNT